MFENYEGHALNHSVAYERLETSDLTNGILTLTKGAFFTESLKLTSDKDDTIFDAWRPAALNNDLTKLCNREVHELLELTYVGDLPEVVYASYIYTGTSTTSLPRVTNVLNNLGNLTNPQIYSLIEDLPSILDAKASKVSLRLIDGLDDVRDILKNIITDYTANRLNVNSVRSYLESAVNLDTYQPLLTPTFVTESKEVPGALEEIYQWASNPVSVSGDYTDFIGTLNSDIDLSEWNSVTTSWWAVTAPITVTVIIDGHSTNLGLKPLDIILYTASTKEFSVGYLGSFISYANSQLATLDSELTTRLNSHSDLLETTNKTITGAINELTGLLTGRPIDGYDHLGGLSTDTDITDQCTSYSKDWIVSSECTITGPWVDGDYVKLCVKDSIVSYKFESNTLVLIDELAKVSSLVNTLNPKLTNDLTNLVKLVEPGLTTISKNVLTAISELNDALLAKGAYQVRTGGIVDGAIKLVPEDYISMNTLASVPSTEAYNPPKLTTVELSSGESVVVTDRAIITDTINDPDVNHLDLLSNIDNTLTASNYLPTTFQGEDLSSYLKTQRTALTAYPPEDYFNDQQTRLDNGYTLATDLVESELVKYKALASLKLGALVYPKFTTDLGVPTTTTSFALFSKWLVKATVDTVLTLTVYEDHPSNGWVVVTSCILPWGVVTAVHLSMGGVPATPTLSVTGVDSTGTAIHDVLYLANSVLTPISINATYLYPTYNINTLGYPTLVLPNASIIRAGTTASNTVVIDKLNNTQVVTNTLTIDPTAILSTWVGLPEVLAIANTLTNLYILLGTTTNNLTTRTILLKLTLDLTIVSIQHLGSTNGIYKGSLSISPTGEVYSLMGSTVSNLTPVKVTNNERLKLDLGEVTVHGMVTTDTKLGPHYHLTIDGVEMVALIDFGRD